MKLRGPALAALSLLALSACSRGSDSASQNDTDQIILTEPNVGVEDANVVTVGAEDVVEDAAATPMAERVAVIGILNKRNGVTREFRLKPGQATRIDNVLVHLRACDQTPPWELNQLTGAFLWVDAEGLDKKWRRVFSGWLFKERPAANVVEHAIYDVWPKSCEMTFKDRGEATVDAPSGPTGPAPSSEKKSPEEAETAPSGAPSPPSAASSNSM